MLPFVLLSQNVVLECSFIQEKEEEVVAPLVPPTPLEQVFEHVAAV